MVKLFGSLFDSNEKELKRLYPYIGEINELEPEFQALTDEELKAKTEEFKARFKEGEELDDLLPEAFAAVREAARRTIGQRHYDVQLLGGVTLHQGKIAEMKTGEGKTLVATLPLYLNSLTGKGAHLVTVNDYLARRDPYWMGPIYQALGVSVASIYPMQTPDEHTPARLYDPSYDSGKEIDLWRHFRPVSRQEAYQADITYGTSSEFGFDFLRDNMVVDLARCVQRPLYYAIVDEVDNLLIDEARTPLIISGPAEETGQLYKAVNEVVARMSGKVLPYEPKSHNYEEKEELENLKKTADYIAYEKEHYVETTARGQEKLARAFRMRAEDLFGGESTDESPSLSFEEARRNNDIQSVFRQSLNAHALFRRDREYVVENGEIVIVDEFTGRKMYGRRYSEGLHQAIEAKEHVKVQRESLTYATITIQNFFRMYEKLAGMTGTAATEAEEFYKIYKLEVTEVPTNKPMIREDNPDLVYKTEEGKFRAIAREIKQLHGKGTPILIGTVSIEKSELLNGILKRQGVTCQILNAKEHTKEGKIIEDAGLPGMVTVATNMAGRGVDIVLGGSKPEKPESNDAEELKQYENELAAWQQKHDKIIELGGLHIVGTERHEARRIDNQLRGRAGRQGDPGDTRFFISLEDDIMRRFGGDRLKGVMGFLGLDEDTPIENKMLTNMVTDVQKRVEGYHFDIRKNLVEYDDVVNLHRKIIYSQRQEILKSPTLRDKALEWVNLHLKKIVKSCRIFAETIPHLRDVDHYTIDEMSQKVNLNSEGKTEIVKALIKEGILEFANQYDSDFSPLDEPVNFWLDRYIKSASRAHLVLHKERDIEGLINEVLATFRLPSELNTSYFDSLDYGQIEEKLIESAKTIYEQRENELGQEKSCILDRLVMLQAIDKLWIEHLTAMERERLQAGWQTLRQMKSSDAYKLIGHQSFGKLGATIRYDVASVILRAGFLQRGEKAPVSPMAKADMGSKGDSKPAPSGNKKVGRNDPCPCGSGKKYKHCCGR